jgi:hypothetical protein
MQPALWDNQINAVAANATPGWCDAAYEAVVRVARRHAHFTTDDVWLAIDGPITHDNRALGAVMRRARTEKVCEPTMHYRPSTRDVCHGRPVRVWRSLA